MKCSTSRKKSKILALIGLDFDCKRSVTDSAGAAALRDLSPRRTLCLGGVEAVRRMAPR
jgi:hypothetical protein